MFQRRGQQVLDAVAAAGWQRRHVGGSQASFAGDDTPIYDRFLWRRLSITPRVSVPRGRPVCQGLNVGGHSCGLNSLEYQIPVVASDKFYLVSFIDSALWSGG